MQKRRSLVVFFVVLLVNGVFLALLPAQTPTFVSGNTGADGAFNPTTNTTLTLPPNGVFNFTTVNIPAGINVTFTKNAANTPVIILATGDVTITGQILLNGTDAVTVTPGEGGPGGFRGGEGGLIDTIGIGGNGLGPGGGLPGTTVMAGPLGSAGGGGGFGSTGSPSTGGAPGGPSYSNASILPSLGGSGGGGGRSITTGRGGGGGGGAGSILIASSTKISFSNGVLSANGGNGANLDTFAGGGGGGSGGGIRLIANTIEGSGRLEAVGGRGGVSGVGREFGGAGGNGRIRLEAFKLTFLSGTTPTYTSSTPGPVFIPAPAPTLNFTSVKGVAVPSAPVGSYSSPDITLPASTTNPITVALAASNIPGGTSVEVSSIPQFGSKTTTTVILSGTTNSSTATASINIVLDKVNVLSAQVTFIQTASLMFPEIDGEKVELAMLTSTLGQGSMLTYVTVSGREHHADQLGVWPLIRVDSRR